MSIEKNANDIRKFSVFSNSEFNSLTLPSLHFVRGQTQEHETTNTYLGLPFPIFNLNRTIRSLAPCGRLETRIRRGQAPRLR